MIVSNKEVVKVSEEIPEEKECAKQNRRNKRDIFRFNGEKPTAINLEHVTMMSIEDKRITFAFASNGVYIDLDTSEIANSVFEQLLNAWARDG